MDAAAWLVAVRDAERRGELLTAFDIAERGLAEHPGDVWLAHRAVLALARAGSTHEAALRFSAYGLAGIEDEDVAALGARLEKDVALATTGAARRGHAARSSALYADIFARTGGYYPAINAATLALVAGDGARARAFAERALALARPEQSYWAAATEAEALLLLDRSEQVRAAVARAAARHGGDFGALATTRRQLRLVCELTGVGDEVLDALAGPGVVHFCGHRIAPPGQHGRFPASVEEEVAGRIAAAVEANPCGYAYGALAAGGDILWAEALLARGVELNVVLPCAREAFVRASVASSGPGWVQRFERCLRAASSVTYATDDAVRGDDVLFRYATELAMGLALLRARFLDVEARQLALWDGRPARGGAGTAIDVATWRSGGRRTTVIPIPVCDTPAAAPAATADKEARGPRRVVRALLFADFKGFSKLTDDQLPRFAEHVLGALATVLDRHHASVCHRNTWGDGLYVVLTDPPAAAECALDLQTAVQHANRGVAGLPSPLALRLGGHVGPVYEVTDPVLRAPAYVGSHVSRTARIEPVTPPGTVYVTEAFAAALLLAGHDELVSDYIGHMPAAKDYGRLRMHRLRRRPTGQPTAATAGRDPRADTALA